MSKFSTMSNHDYVFQPQRAFVIPSTMNPPRPIVPFNMIINIIHVETYQLAVIAQCEIFHSTRIS